MQMKQASLLSTCISIQGAHEVGRMISAEVPLMVRPRKTCKLQGPCGLLPAPPNHSSSHTALPCCHDIAATLKAAYRQASFSCALTLPRQGPLYRTCQAMLQPTICGLKCKSSHGVS